MLVDSLGIKLLCWLTLWENIGSDAVDPVHTLLVDFVGIMGLNRKTNREFYGSLMIDLVRGKGSGLHG